MEVSDEIKNIMNLIVLETNFYTDTMISKRTTFKIWIFWPVKGITFYKITFVSFVLNMNGKT